MLGFHDFRIGWRVLRRRPAYFAVAVLGLMTGFAIFFLLTGFAAYSLDYEKGIPGSEDVYILKGRFNTGVNQEWAEWMPLPFRDMLEQTGLILSSTAVIPFPVSMRAGDRVKKVELSAVDAGFEQIFGVRVLAGTLKTALSQPDALALTVRTANALFGRTDVVGETLQIAGLPYRVAALIDDPVSNTTVPYAALTGMNTPVWPEKDRQVVQSSWTRIAGRIYVRLAHGVSPKVVEQAARKAIDKSPLRSQIPAERLRDLGEKKIVDIRLGRLSEAYFDRDVAHSALTYSVWGASGSGKRGDKAAIGGVAAIASLVLLLAIINYVNLATVRSLERDLEIGIRKVLGANAARISGLFLAESVLVSLLSAGSGLLVAWLLLPAFSHLLDRDLEHIFTLPFLSGAALLGLLVGIAAGAYPAWIALRLHDARLLPVRSGTETMRGAKMRSALTALEFAMATSLIAMTIAVAWQAEYARRFNPGFDTARLLVIKLPDFLGNPACRAFRDRLKLLPGVSGVADTVHVFGRDHWDQKIIVGVGGKFITLPLQGVSPEFFGVYGIHALAGRVFDATIDPPEDTHVAIVNVAAARAMGFSSPESAIGKILNYNVGNFYGTTRIIGIVPDIRYETLRESPRPVGYTLALAKSVVTVRVKGDMNTVRKATEKLWRQDFPDDVLNIESAESMFARNYDNDLRLAELLAASSIVAIVIAAFGVYVLSAYNVRRRAREIVLRKLYGAKRGDIARLVGRELFVLVAVGAAIGLPVAAAGIAHYLNGFVERAPMGLWPLLTALAIVVVAAFLAAFRHMATAMRLAPALALRC